MAAPPTFEVSVKVRPTTKGINTIFGVQDEDNRTTVCNGVVACKNFRAEHQAKHPFEFDKVFVDSQSNEQLFNVSARHIVHSAIAGGHGCITVQPSHFSVGGVSNDVLFGTSASNFGLLPMTMIELLRHSSTGDYRICLSAVIFHNETQQEAIPLTQINSLTELITRTAALTSIDTCKHFSITLHIQGILGEGRIYITRLGSSQYRQGLALGSMFNVLNSLSRGRKHIPYRESRVTQHLRSGLAPACANLFLLLVDSAPVDFSRALSDLKMADRLRGSCFPITAGSGPANFVRELPLIRKTVGNGKLNPVSNFILSEEDARLIRSLNEDDDVKDDSPVAGQSLHSSCGFPVDDPVDVECQSESIIIFPEEPSRITDRRAHEPVLQNILYKKPPPDIEVPQPPIYPPPVQTAPSSSVSVDHRCDTSVGEKEASTSPIEISPPQKVNKEQSSQTGGSPPRKPVVDKVSEPPAEDDDHSPWDAVQREVRAMETSVAYLCQSDVIDQQKAMTRSKTGSTSYSTSTQPAPCYDIADGKPPRFDSHERQRPAQPPTGHGPPQYQNSKRDGAINNTTTELFDSHEQKQNTQYRPPLSRRSSMSDIVNINQGTPSRDQDQQQRESYIIREGYIDDDNHNYREQVADRTGYREPPVINGRDRMGSRESLNSDRGGRSSIHFDNHNYQQQQQQQQHQSVKDPPRQQGLYPPDTTAYSRSVADSARFRSHHDTDETQYSVERMQYHQNGDNEIRGDNILHRVHNQNPSYRRMSSTDDRRNRSYQHHQHHHHHDHYDDSDISHRPCHDPETSGRYDRRTQHHQSNRDSTYHREGNLSQYQYTDTRTVDGVMFGEGQRGIQSDGLIQEADSFEQQQRGRTSKMYKLNGAGGDQHLEQHLPVYQNQTAGRLQRQQQQPQQQPQQPQHEPSWRDSSQQPSLILSGVANSEMSPNTQKHFDSLTALQQKTAALLGISTSPPAATCSAKRETYHPDNPFDEMLRENEQLEAQFLRKQLRELASASHHVG